MAQFAGFLGNGSQAITTIQGNGITLPAESILNFIGVDYTFTDDPGNNRTNIALPALVHIAGSTMTGPLILSGDPVTGLQAATKQYVDSAASGLSPRTSCRLATTAALTSNYNNGASGVGATLTNSGTQAALTLDGVATVLNDRVLVKDQAGGQNPFNGIYTVTNIGSGASNWVLTRATDFDQASASEVASGAYTVIIEGTVNAANLFVETGAGPFTIGTTPIIFSAFNSAANLSATAPLSLVGNVLSLTTPLTPTFGGTGIANSNANTITLGGTINTASTFATSGAFPLTLTTTASTNVTLPTSGTLITSAVTALPSLVTIGTITAGTWNGTIISPIYGGTGINNGTSTITLGGSLTTSGAFASTFTMTNTTNVTFPTSGTLATTSAIPSFPLSLANGGTNANLVASNGGIFYSTATAGAILAGTATANQVLLSGASGTPAWSTATYPATTTVNQLLYSSSANVVAGLATGNNGTLITSAGGVPSISSTLPSAVQTNITATGALAAGSLTTGFTPVTVPFGGTGNTTFTAYSVICAGTTATGTFQNVSGVGSSAQVLTSNGAAALPTWQTLSLPVGSIVQVVTTTLTSTFTTSSTTFVDLTGLSAAITPTKNTHTIYVIVTISCGGPSSNSIDFQLVRTSTAIGLGAAAGSRTPVSFSGGVTGGTSEMRTAAFNFLDSPTTTSATTYKLQIRSGIGSSAAVYVNQTQTDTNSAAYPRGASTITLLEVVA